MSTTAPVRDVLRDILRVASRYVLAGALFHSGMRMVLNLAGIHPGPIEWVTPLGEMSGAQFAALWLGVSPTFQFLGGLVQVACGSLLLSPATTTLGALIAAGCFTNSVMLDLCFRPSPWVADAVLLVFSLYLVALDWRMLLNLLLLDRPTTPIPTEPTWETPPIRQMGRVLKAAILVYFVYANGFLMVRTKQDAEAQSQLSGAYSVASFSPTNADIEHRWHVAAIDQHAERLAIRTVNGAGITFRIQPVVPQGASSHQPGGYRERVALTAAPQGQITLVAPDGSRSVWNYSRSSTGELSLTGELNGIAMEADMHVTPAAGLPLLTPGAGFAEPR